MKTLKQLIREFWAPFFLAIMWTTYNLLTSARPWDLRTTINVFGPTFFLLSWGTGQFFRVRKQSRVEDSFQSIERRLNELLGTLDQRTQDLIGYATGADAIVRFDGFFNVADPHVLMLSASNQSKYPVHDVQGEWIDLDEPIDPSNGKFWTRHRFSLPSLWPNRVVMDFMRFDMRNRERLRINIFFHTRSSGGTVQIRAVKATDRLLIATKRQGPSDSVEYQVPPNFPGLDPTDPDAVFK